MIPASSRIVRVRRSICTIRVPVTCGGKSVVVPEQLVCAVDQIDVQRRLHDERYHHRSGKRRTLPMTTEPATGFALAPPVEPMLAKLAEELPTSGPFLYEPKWD